MIAEAKLSPIFLKNELSTEMHSTKVVTRCAQKSCTSYTFWKWILYIKVIRSSDHNKSLENSFSLSWNISDFWLRFSLFSTHTKQQVQLYFEYFTLLSGAGFILKSRLLLSRSINQTVHCHVHKSHGVQPAETKPRSHLNFSKILQFFLTRSVPLKLSNKFCRPINFLSPLCLIHFHLQLLNTFCAT
jgi:hypothetical protein